MKASRFLNDIFKPSYEFDDEWMQDIFRRYEDHDLPGLWEEYADWCAHPKREKQDEHLKILRSVIAWRMQVLSFDQFHYFCDTLFDEVIGVMEKRFEKLKKWESHRHETFGRGYSGKPVY